MTAEPGGMRSRLSEAALMAACAGLLAGLAYAAEKMFRTVVFDRVLGTSRDVIWMAPLATVVIFMSVAVLGAIVGRLFPARLARWLMAFGLATLACLSVTFQFPYASHMALGVLSAGAGVVFAGAVSVRPALWLKRMRVGVVAMGVLVAVGSAWSYLALIRGEEQSALVDRGAAWPNVLLVVLDAVGASGVSLHGNPREVTPNIDRFAREGVAFDSMYATAPWTLPSHLSMFTGDYQLPDSARSKFLYRPRESHPRLATVLRSMGYATVGVVGNLWRAQWDTGLHDGFDVYADHERSPEQVLRSSILGQTRIVRDMIDSRTWSAAWKAIAETDFTTPPVQFNPKKVADEVSDRFLDWYSSRPQRPFFAFLNYVDTHAPYMPPAAFEKRYMPEPDSRALYDAGLAFADEQVNRLFEHLRADGTLDNTIVIVTSDHGELFGQHGLKEHSSNLYEELLHVPLIVRFPSRVPAGLRIRRPASLRDLAATIVDLTGAGAHASFPGVSLASAWEDSTVQTSPVLSSVDQGIRQDSILPFAVGSLVSLMVPPWRYIRNNGSGREELYNLAEDPGELTDRSGTPERAGLLRQLRDSTNALIRRHALPGRLSALRALPPGGD